ncbi:MAG: hypothetical protein KFF73_12280 [Cyclobacteriaceae bacterium]|nr:hypothetical protein [Cyclobacteriaceae bacterium]
MAFYENLINRLFPKDKEVIIHEVLKRSVPFSRSYDLWKSSSQAAEELQAVSESYDNRLSDIKPSIDIEVYFSPYANGIVIYPERGEFPLSIEFIMEYIREKLELTDYRLVHADRKMTERGKMVTALEKYYLKPPLSADIPIDQKFGNVILELSYENDLPLKFKMMANIYSDRLYHEAHAFDDLIVLLFG